MRLSLIIASHNEGERLSRTVHSCQETCGRLEHEVVIADDASTDGSVDEVARRFPRVRIVRQDKREGASSTKALGAQHARGEVLVFLDGHTKPEYGAIARLVEDVESLSEPAIVTPQIASLDTNRWRNDFSQCGNGYFLEFQGFDCGWKGLQELKEVREGRRRFYESPALIGCALAVRRDLYEKLWGFDRHMRFWGVEDLDFGLKCWLLGHRILHDPQAVVGHRFRAHFDNYSVPLEHVVVNQLRMARKNFTPTVWAEWLDRCRQQHGGGLAGHPEGLWASVWHLFNADRSSAEQERSYLHANRVYDEFWYANRFGLPWPRLQSGTVFPRAAFSLAASPSPGPHPSHPPPKLTLISPANNASFAISGAPAMPTVSARAKIVGVTPDPTPTTSFEWTVQIRYNASTCPHGPNRNINPPDIVQTVVGGTFTPAFPLVRGGQLTLIVKATVGGVALQAQSTGLVIQATNPRKIDVHDALPHDALRRIACQESGMRQFLAAANGGVGRCPLWSADNAGGAGIMQITRPLPTDDQVWNWRANLVAGAGIFNQKVATARSYPALVRASAGFARKVTDLNAARQNQGLPALQVGLPNFTSGDFNNNLQQLELDAIRGYNGWAGRDVFGNALHEFRVALDANGLLQVNIQPNTTNATAIWERVPAADRPQAVGDPDYVNHVLARSPFC